MSGRKPWIPTQEIYQQVEEWVGQGLTEQSIAQRLGIKPATYWKKKREYPELAEAVMRGKTRDESLCMNRIRAIAFNDGHKQHLTALIFYGKINFGWNDKGFDAPSKDLPSKVNLNVITSD